MLYSETGQFTPEQIKLAKKIASSIKKLRKTGVVVVGKQDKLFAYLKEDYDHATLGVNCDYSHPVPCLECGGIDDSGADDTEYFELGHITEE